MNTGTDTPIGEMLTFAKLDALMDQIERAALPDSLLRPFTEIPMVISHAEPSSYLYRILREHITAPIGPLPWHRSAYTTEGMLYLIEPEKLQPDDERFRYFGIDWGFGKSYTTRFYPNEEIT